MIIISEKITLKFLIHLYVKKLSNKKKFDGAKIYFIDNNQSLIVNIVFRIFFHQKIKKLNWELLNFKFEDNTNIWMKIANTNSYDIIDEIITKNINLYESDRQFYIYLFKKLRAENWPDSEKRLFQILIIIYVVSQTFNKNNKKSSDIYLFFNNLFSNDIISSFAKTLGVNIYNIRHNKVNIHIKQLLKIIIARFVNNKYITKNNRPCKLKFNLSKTNNIVLEFALTMNNPIDFIDQKSLFYNKLIIVNRIEQIGLSRGLTQKELEFTNDSKFKYYQFSNSKFFNSHFYYNNIKNYHLKKNINSYYKFIKKYFLVEKNIWINFFKLSKTKIYYTTTSYDHCFPASSAIKDLGGINALSQMSYSDQKSLSINADILFTFNPYPLDVIYEKYSTARYIVKAGYTNDYNFKKAKIKSQNIKSKLKSRGAQKIICFYDQGESLDARYSYGYFNSSKDYEFILKKLLSNDWLGLIIKPKKPGLLKEKLSSSYYLLDEAINTGRCHISLKTKSNHVKDFDNPPCVAANASDLAIHSSPALTCTPGIEAYLSNTPTLFYDPFNNIFSKIRNINNIKNVFNNWNDLWDASINFLFNNQKDIYGNYKYLINKIDPFNDGNASNRIIKYLYDLSEISNNNYSNEKILNIVAEDYAKTWGDDNIIKIK